MPQLYVSFSTPIDFKALSFIIKKTLNTEFSHVEIKFKSDKFDRVLIYQASGLAVNFVEEQRFMKSHKILHEFVLDVSEETYIKTIQFAIDHAGVPYGISQIFGILYVKVLELFGKRVKNPFPNGNGNYVCSELVAQILKEKIGLAGDIELDTIDPKEVLELLQKNDVLEIV